MIHRRVILVAVALAAGLLLISSVLVMAATTAFSHGFESSEGGVGDWVDTGGVTYGISTTSPSAHGGSQSAWVRHSRTTASGIQNKDRFSATAGHDYTFEGWVYVSDSSEGLNVDQAYLRIAWYENVTGGSQMSPADSTKWISGTNNRGEWVHLMGSDTAPAGTNYAEIRCYTKSTADGTYALANFDDILVTDESATAITLSTFTAHPTSPQPTFFRWQWLALAGAVGIVLEVGAVARRLLRR
jgi:hypothetical protein